MTVNFPIYDSPFRYWGLATDYPEKDPSQKTDETKGDSSGSVSIVLREGQVEYGHVEAIYHGG